MSVVVPTKDRPGFLAHTLETLAGQSFDGDFEIIVVDDGSNPPAAAPDGIRVVRHPEPRGVNAARNTGAASARFDLVCYVDDDIHAPDDWLSEFSAGAQRHPTASCFAGAIKVRFEGAPIRLCSQCASGPQEESNLDLDEEEGPTSEYAVGANFGVRKEALGQAGPFDEDHPIYYEEYEWQNRLRSVGGTVVYLPRAWLWHRRPEEATRFAARLQRRIKAGWGNAYYRRSQGLPVEFGSMATIVLVGLGHTVHHRCPNGFLRAVEAFGVLVGGVRFARVRPST